MKHFWLLLFFCILFPAGNKIYSQELRSGEITYTGIAPFNDYHIQARFAIFTDPANTTRPYLHISWGDGTSDSIAFPVPNMTACHANYYNFSNVDHYYPGTGTYIISIDEPFYMANINNILNSDTQSFRLEKDVILNPLLGLNSSPIFIYPQECLWIDTNTVFDLISYDADPNDSLGFELTSPLVSNFITPTCTLDSLYGDLYFFPDSIGKYTIVIKINEWRKIGNDLYYMGSTVRQMLVDVNGFVSVSDFNLNSEILLFPSPTNNFLNIQSKTSFIESATISDLTGKIIYYKKISGTNEPLDVSFLNSGLYFLNLNTEKGYCTKKFIRE